MDNHAADPTPTILAGDCLEHLAKLAPDSIDAIVTDPPYGLGFMGKAWDELPPGPEWAEACLRVLKPGGHLLAFGGTRTWHRLAVAVEDAGFEIRDSIFWLYGSGMPKSHNLKGDKAGFGTALKPAAEPAVLARKPFKGTVAANVQEHGTGALNIDACRIEGVVPSVPQPVYGVKDDGVTQFGSGVGRNGQMSSAPGGRWPANVVLDEDAAAALDQQSGNVRGAPGMRQIGGSVTFTVGEQINRKKFIQGDEDSGGASRFFYVSKPSKSERPNVDGVQHPTVKPLALMRWLVRLVTPPGGIVLDPFAGSGTTIEAALLEGFDVIGIERELTYLPLVSARVERAQHERREHGIGRKLEDR